MGGKASLKAGAYGDLAWKQQGSGHVASSLDGHLERVPVRRLDAFQAETLVFFRA